MWLKLIKTLVLTLLPIVIDIVTDWARNGGDLSELITTGQRYADSANSDLRSFHKTPTA